MYEIFAGGRLFENFLVRILNNMDFIDVDRRTIQMVHGNNCFVRIFCENDI